MSIFVKNKNFYKTLVAFSLPIAAQSLITVGVNMADNVMLGQLGESAMSGVSLANNFIMIYTIMCMGLGMGASVLTSRFFGAKDSENLKKSVNIMFRLQLIVIVFFSLLTLLIPDLIMGLYSKEELVIALGKGYLLISIPCYFLQGYTLTSSLVLRSVGKGNIPLIASVSSFFINIFFNWVFIFGHLGAPAMGVNGAALGTLIARIVEFVITVYYLFVVDKTIGFRIKDLKQEVSDLLPDYIRISIPVLISDTLLGIGSSATSVVMGHIGSTFVAANAIASMVNQLATVVIQGISQASCTITGITIGLEKYDEAQEQGVTFAALGVIIGAIACALILLIRDPVISLYKIEQDTVELTKQIMDALAVVMVFQCSNSILTKGVLRGGGDTKFLMVADIIFLWIFSIPLGYVAGIVLKLPGFWTFMALKIDQFIKAIICVIRLNSKKWIKKIK